MANNLSTGRDRKARGPIAYCRVVLSTALSHSLHAAHSIILGLIIAAGLVTYFFPRVELLVDLHGWHVATAVLVGIVVVRLLLAPYWIWKDDGATISDQISRLSSQTDEAKKRAKIDQLSEEIKWATDNLVNPNPHPLRPGADTRTEIASWSTRCDKWYEKVSDILSDREFFTRPQQLNFDTLTLVDQVVTIGNMEFGHPYNILHTKIRRLREIVNQVAHP